MQKICHTTRRHSTSTILSLKVEEVDYRWRFEIKEITDKLKSSHRLTSFSKKTVLCPLPPDYCPFTKIKDLTKNLKILNLKNEFIVSVGGLSEAVKYAQECHQMSPGLKV